jgi:hypothetical protein
MATEKQEMQSSRRINIGSRVSGHNARQRDGSDGFLRLPFWYCWLARSLPWLLQSQYERASMYVVKF